MTDHPPKETPREMPPENEWPEAVVEKLAKEVWGDDLGVGGDDEVVEAMTQARKILDALSEHVVPRAVLEEAEKEREERVEEFRLRWENRDGEPCFSTPTTERATAERGAERHGHTLQHRFLTEHRTPWEDIDDEH